MDIRLATLADALQISAIYRPYVESTFISFETQAPGEAEMAERMRKVTARLPWLVCEDTGHILGYAYASRHHERVSGRLPRRPADEATRRLRPRAAQPAGPGDLRAAR